MTTAKARPICQDPGTNHSTDTVTVWHGRPEPLVLCGYHESRLDAAMFRELEGVTL